MTKPNADADSVGPLLLSLWLVENGYAEETRGYGHVSGDELAEALLAHFIIKLPHNDSEVTFDPAGITYGLGGS